MPGLVLGQNILLFENKNFEALVVLADAESSGQSDNPTSDYTDLGFHSIDENIYQLSELLHLLIAELGFELISPRPFVVMILPLSDTITRVGIP